MNNLKDKLDAMTAQVRIGGKGTARRKKKVIRKTATSDDKKLQSNLKKLSVTNIPGIDEVNMMKEDGTVMHFANPKVQASVPGNTFAIVGRGENKEIPDMMPGILNQLGPESLVHLNQLMMGGDITSGGRGFDIGGGILNSNNHPAVATVEEEVDEDVPELVGDLDEPSKQQELIKTATAATTATAPTPVQ